MTAGKLTYGDTAAREVSGRIAEAGTLAEIKAVPATNRADKMLALVGGWLYRFLASSADASGVAPDAGTGKWMAVYAPTRAVRGVVFANVADLAAFTVASNDGLTYVEGQRVLLANQTTAAQNGIYVVGAVTTGAAPLTRANDFLAGDAIVNGTVVEVSEGTIFAGSTWKAMCTGAKVVATDDPVFYPKTCKARVTLAGGTSIYALGSTEGLFLFSTTKSQVNFDYVTYAGTIGTAGLAAPVSARTAGKSGTAALTVGAFNEDKGAAGGDTSTVDVVVTNW